MYMRYVGGGIGHYAVNLPGNEEDAPSGDADSDEENEAVCEVMPDQVDVDNDNVEGCGDSEDDIEEEEEEAMDKGGQDNGLDIGPEDGEDVVDVDGDVQHIGALQPVFGLVRVST